LLFNIRYNDVGPDVFYVEEAQETLKHIQKIGVTTLASKWIMSNAKPEVIPYEEQTMTKTSSSITDNLFGLIKSSDIQTIPSKQIVNPLNNKKSQELPSILKKRNSEENPMISGSGEYRNYIYIYINNEIHKFLTFTFLYYNFYNNIHKNIVLFYAC